MHLPAQHQHSACRKYIYHGTLSTPVLLYLGGCSRDVDWLSTIRRQYHRAKITRACVGTMNFTWLDILFFGKFMHGVIHIRVNQCCVVIAGFCVVVQDQTELR